MLPSLNQLPNNQNINMDNEIGNIDNNDFGNQEGFDANVEADAETEPKKYIQQLTGKLSQELRKYNQDGENQDNELNKYVLGMLIPQATTSMNDKDKNEIVKKIQKNNVDDLDNDSEIPQTNENKLSKDTIDTLSQETKRYRLKNKIKVNNNPFLIEK